jgi:hypothetical protein
MLHHHITEMDLAKLTDMKTADLEEYLKEIGARLRHLRAVTNEARELELAIGRELHSRLFLLA